MVIRFWIFAPNESQFKKAMKVSFKFTRLGKKQTNFKTCHIDWIRTFKIDNVDAKFAGSVRKFGENICIWL